MLTTWTQGSIILQRPRRGNITRLCLFSPLTWSLLCQLGPLWSWYPLCCCRWPFQYENLTVLLLPCWKSSVLPITHQLATSLWLSSRAPSSPTTESGLPLHTFTCDFLCVILYSYPSRLSSFSSSLSISSKPSPMPRACHEPPLRPVLIWHIAHSLRAGSSTQVWYVAK